MMTTEHKENNMNDYDIRIGALEAEITALKDRLAHYESEHLSLAASRDATRYEADETLRLASEYWERASAA